MLVHADDETGECESRGVAMAMRHRSFGMADRGRPVLFAQPAAQKQRVITLGGVGVRQRIIWIERERTFQKQKRLRRTLGSSRVNIVLSLQDKIIGVEAIRALAFDALDLGLLQARLDRADDGKGN